jgi:hypothetical protein
VNPPDSSTNVSVQTAVAISFPLDLDIRTVTRNNVLLTDDHRRVVPSRVFYDAATRTITLVPNEPLSPGQTFSVLLQDVRTTTDVTFNTQVTRFTTGLDANVRPTIVSVRPLAGQAEVGNLTPISITFSKIMDQSSLLSTFSVAPTVPGTVALSVTSSVPPQSIMTFTPSEPYPAGERMTITVRSEASDTSNRTLGTAFTSIFFVEKPPAVVDGSVSPADGAVRVNVSAAVTLDFTRLMDEESVRDAMNLVFGSTTLGRADGTYTFQVVSVDERGQPVPPRTRVTYQPTSALPASTSILVRVSGTARSVPSAVSSGLGLDPIFLSTFQTAP